MSRLRRKQAKQNYAEFVERLKLQQHFGSALALLSWDQETYMPEEGAVARAELSAGIAGQAHEYATSGRMTALYRKLIEEIHTHGAGHRLACSARLEHSGGSRLTPAQKVVVQESHRRFVRKKKIPTEHVFKEVRITSLAHQAWVKARKTSDFSIVLPHLEAIVKLKRRECELIGYDAHPYDALLDDYEPHTRTSDIDALFDQLREPLTNIAEKIIHSRRVIRSPRAGSLPNGRGAKEEEARALEFCKELLTEMGFDFERGRLDESVHPFATMMHPSDVRMTVRRERSPIDMIFSALHEGGHALYSQGLDIGHWGTPLADAVSLGIHESQSRLWENQIGRGRPFWKYYFPRLQKKLPRIFGRRNLEEFLREVNHVSFSPIRVDADEVTYSLHVILRFELEKALIEGSLRPRDIPAAWNEKMAQYLHIKPKNDAQGCLQDVHWYTGGIGYFPTYVLGNLYAAQFFKGYRASFPKWKSDLEGGRLKPLAGWLKQNIHRHGCRYTAFELVRKVTGESLSAKYFLEYLEEKYA